MRIRITDEEIRLQKRIIRLTARGRADEAVRFYENEVPFIESARTHYVAFVAACDCRKSEEALDAIYARADKCADIDEVELDFARDRAIRLIEGKPKGKRNTEEALVTIRKVMRSRRDDEGQDRS